MSVRDHIASVVTGPGYHAPQATREVCLDEDIEEDEPAPSKRFRRRGDDPKPPTSAEWVLNIVGEARHPMPADDIIARARRHGIKDNTTRANLTKLYKLNKLARSGSHAAYSYRVNP